MWFAERLLALIAPHTCRGCAVEGSVLCGACAIALPPVASRCYRCQRVSRAFRTCKACRSGGLYAVQPFTAYTAIPKAVLHALKFERADAAAIDVARAMALRGLVSNDVVITHIPTVPARVRLRGYDQAALIARELARVTGAAYTPLLARTGGGRQVGQTRAVRRAQMQQAFRPLRPHVVQNKHVLLIDDVLTTGATCEAAARVLREAGAKRVSALVFAVA